MKQDMIAPVEVVPLAPVVTVLEQECRLELDPNPLSALFALKGEAEAEETFCRVLEDIAHRINQLDGPRWRAAFTEIDAPAERIAAIAGQLGLIGVSTSARHVATAARQADGVALEATMSRLERSFDAAISQVWNFHVML